MADNGRCFSDTKNKFPVNFLEISATLGFGRLSEQRFEITE